MLIGQSAAHSKAIRTLSVAISLSRVENCPGCGAECHASQLHGTIVTTRLCRILIISVDIQNLQIAQQIVVSCLNDTEQKSEAFDFYKHKKLGDFAIDSLELFEMIMKVEEVIGLEIDDSIIESDLAIEELTTKLINPD